MLKHGRLLNKIGVFSTVLLLVILAWTALIPEIALSQQVESRLNNLESDINRIESRLNQIQAQLERTGRFEAPRTRPTPPRTTNGGRNTQVNREQMFDRLATLVIELREQIKQLEARVSKLESQAPPRTKT